MALFTTSANESFLPQQIGAMVVRPALDLSVAAQVATIITTGNSVFRIPILSADSVANWVPEGGPIGVSDPTLSEVVITPSKIAVVVPVSRELADDASPEAATIVGQSAARAIARRLDESFFGNTTADGQDGLLSLVTSTAVETATEFTSLDAFASAISIAEGEGVTTTTFVTSPSEALSLSTLKQEATSTRPLLTPDPTVPTSRQVYGRPLLVSKYIGAKVAWAIPRDRVFLIVRSDATIEVDRSVGFMNDLVHVKATMRVGFALAAQPLSIVKITHA